MAYDRQQLLVSWLFRDISSAEIAVTSLHYSSVTPPYASAGADLDSMDLSLGGGQDLIDEMESFIGLANLFWANYSQLWAVKIAALGLDGLYITEPKTFETPLPIVGTSTTTLPQSTVVLSLRSGSSLGSANNGRMYLPHTRLVLNTNSSSSTVGNTAAVLTQAQLFENAVTATINDLAASASILRPFIMSNQAPKPSKAVAGFRVGTVTDTQRRRRNDIPEVYSSGAVLP